MYFFQRRLKGGSLTEACEHSVAYNGENHSYGRHHAEKMRIIRQHPSRVLFFYPIFRRTGFFGYWCIVIIVHFCWKQEVKPTGAMTDEKDVPLPHQVKGTPPRRAVHTAQVTCIMGRIDQQMYLLQTTEELRRQLIQLVQETGSLSNDTVVELSQRLDQYILAIQNRMNEEKKQT